MCSVTERGDCNSSAPIEHMVAGIDQDPAVPFVWMDLSRQRDSSWARYRALWANHWANVTRSVLYSGALKHGMHNLWYSCGVRSC